MIVHIERPPAQTSDGIYEYSIAGQLLRVDAPVDILSPFCAAHEQGTAIWQSPSVRESHSTHPNRRVRGWVGEAWRDVICQAVEQGYYLSVKGIGTFAIQADGDSISFQEPDEGSAGEKLVIEALLGPALSIALAAKGIFCLHASALMIDNRVVALLGDSGAGKSTVAAYFASRVKGWQRIADDILPIAIENNEIVAMPRFPQLKLPANQQAGPDVPERVRLGGVYWLDVPPQPATPAVTSLGGRAGVTLLIRHTVATSLFDERLLGPHMELCTHIAADIPVKRLIYPHDRGRLAKIAQVLAADITGIA